MQELLNVTKMQAGSRFVQNIERAAGAGLGEFSREFHPLRLAAGKLRRRLAEREVAQAHIDERAKDASNLRHSIKKMGCISGTQFQNIRDRLAVPLGMQCFRGVASAFARLALDPHIWKKMHLHPALAESFTNFAAAARHVEAKRAGRKSACPRFRHLGKQRADVIEDTGVGGGRRAGRGSNRVLIDENHLVDLLESLNRIVCTWLLAGRVQATGERPPENLQHQRRFAAAAGAGYRCQHAERKAHVDSLERAVANATHLQPALWHAATALGDAALRRRAGPFCFEVGTRHALPGVCQRCGGCPGHDLTPFAAAAWAKVEGVIGRGHHIPVVLDNHDGVAQIAKFSESRD